MNDDAYDALNSQLKALSRLVESSLVLSSMLQLRPILEYILDTASSLTGAEAASVMLIDRNTHDLVFEASTNTPIEKLEKITVPMENSIAGTIVCEDRPILINDISEEPRHYSAVGEEVNLEIRSLLGVPMRYQNRVVGVLETLNKIGGEWSEQDRNHLLILASQAAVAVENTRLVEELQHALNEIRQLDKLKSDFIAIASHELRTPLGVILGYASFLREEAEGELGEHAQVVLNSALHLRNLIEDMTSMRNLQVGRRELQMGDVSVRDMLESVKWDVVSLAHVKQQRFEAHLPDPDVTIEADATRLGMALTNIVNNAIKFTPEGGEIALWTEEHGSEVWLCVQDSGPGLPPDQIERIFLQFYQVEDHMTRRHGGMGLGLSIAKAIVEAHQGRIWAESPGINQGSTFIIAIPQKTERNV